MVKSLLSLFILLLLTSFVNAQSLPVFSEPKSESKSASTESVGINYYVILFGSNYTAVIDKGNNIELDRKKMEMTDCVAFYTDILKLDFEKNEAAIKTKTFFLTHFRRLDMYNVAPIDLRVAMDLRIDLNQWFTIMVREDHPNGQVWMTFYGRKITQEKFQIVWPRVRVR